MKEQVVVLHGLALNSWWTCGLAASLRRAGYEVRNVSYRTRASDFQDIVDQFLYPLVQSLPPGKINFAVHSMGGLLVRLYARKYGTERIGRVVMIGTPNHGSEVADWLRGSRVVKFFLGEVGRNLGTKPGDLPAQIGPVTFDCGVIAGTSHWLHFPSSLIARIPKPNDGIVSVASTKIEGMKDHATVRSDHSLMVWNPRVWRLTKSFLKNGKFST